MRLKELLLDWIIDNALFEMAFERKKAIEKVRSKQMQIARYLVKILAFDAPQIHNHWFKEINGWLYDINTTKWNRKNRFKPHEYMYWLWEEPLGHGVDAIQDIFYGLLNLADDHNYTDLPRTNLSNHQILEIMHKIYTDLCFDLSKGQAKQIQRYIQPLLI